mmetsp:Transcript_101627/g.296278  ORF Transcript_101627/g.296278 Transcript_101627/m.296278 type:complete len:258 (-) Transcript_101627:45-818(-)
MAFPVPCQVCVFLAAAVTSGALRLEDGGTQADCTCLNWAPTYQSGMVTCGEGMELGTTMSVGKSRAAALEGDHGCHLYPKLRANFCLKAKQGAHLYGKADDDYDFTWCYVSPSCKALRGGAAVNQRVSWKKCVPGQDKRYGDLHPVTLMAHAQAAGLQYDPTLFAFMAYPYLHATWAQLTSFFNKDASALLALDADVERGLRQIVNSGRPMLICTSLAAPGNGRPDACGKPYTAYVVVGKQIWFFPHFKTPQCIQGC